MSTDIAIRAPREGKWGEIANLLRVCFADEVAVGGTPDTPESVAELQRSGNHLLVMEVGGKIIGFVYLDPSREGAFKLALEPALRGKGYGKQLMEAADEKARSLAWKRLLVGVMDTKQSLVSYYQDLGYKDTGERGEMISRPGYTGPERQLIILGKRLTQIRSNTGKGNRNDAAKRSKHKRDVAKASRRRNRPKK